MSKPGTAQGASPLVHSMKAALYFDNADGFGAWRIQISTRAEPDLRRWGKDDKGMLNTIVNVIK